MRRFSAASSRGATQTLRRRDPQRSAVARRGRGRRGRNPDAHRTGPPSQRRVSHRRSRRAGRAQTRAARTGATCSRRSASTHRAALPARCRATRSRCATRSRRQLPPRFVALSSVRRAHATAACRSPSGRSSRSRCSCADCRCSGLERRRSSTSCGARTRIPRASTSITSATAHSAASAAALSLAELFVGHDSGPLHVAAAFGVPVVGVFAPGQPDRTFPQGTGPSRMMHRPSPAGITAATILREIDALAYLPHDE